MSKDDYLRAIDDGMAQLFEELCAEAKFPKDIADDHCRALKDDLRIVMAQMRDAVDWNGLMAAMTPEEAADGLRSLLREQVRAMMAAEGILPN